MSLEELYNEILTEPMSVRSAPWLETSRERHSLRASLIQADSVTTNGEIWAELRKKKKQITMLQSPMMQCIGNDENEIDVSY